ncbi:MAG: hypothetical protein WC992_06220, partial [Acholeplasmataceae bacterium]
MNKKILIILVLMFSVLSIMLIAVWGTLPENTNRIQLEGLLIEDYDEVNDDGDKFKDVMDIINEQNHMMTISYVLQPENAYVIITATASSDQVNLQVDTFEQKVYVIYDLNAIASKPTVTIRITDQN